MEEFLDKLNDLCKELDDWNNINEGGCCFVAAVLAQNFEKYGIPYTIMMLDDFDSYDENRFNYAVDNRCLDNCTGIFEDVCAHYFLKVNDTFVNPCNPWNLTEIELSSHLQSEDLFWIYETGEWNPSFDTNICEDVADAITQFFDESFPKR